MWQHYNCLDINSVLAGEFEKRKKKKQKGEKDKCLYAFNNSIIDKLSFLLSG